jgi:hypothetical protein
LLRVAKCEHEQYINNDLALTSVGNSMVRDPLIVAWKLEVESPEFLGDLRGVLRPLISVDASMIDETVSLQGGREIHQSQEFKFNNYFERLSVLPPTDGNSSSFRLFFHRKPEASRFWKDIMASVLRKAHQFERPVWIALDYSVTDKAVYRAADQVSLWTNHLGSESRTFWSVSASYLLTHSSFTFKELEEFSEIPEHTLKAMHRNSYRAIKRERSPNPLWSKWDHRLERFVYSMEPAVRDEILTVTEGTWKRRRAFAND